MSLESYMSPGRRRGKDKSEDPSVSTYDIAPAGLQVGVILSDKDGCIQQCLYSPPIINNAVN